MKKYGLAILIFSNIANAAWPQLLMAEKLNSSKSVSFVIHGKPSNKITIVFFWASWCQYCKELGTSLSRIEKGNSGLFRMVGIATDIKKQDSVGPSKNYFRFIMEQYWINQQTTLNLNISRLPTVAIIDKDGRIDTIYEGSESDKINYLKKRLFYLEKKSSADLDSM